MALLIFTLIFRVWVLSWDHGASWPLAPCLLTWLFSGGGGEPEWKSGLNGQAVTSTAFYQQAGHKARLDRGLETGRGDDSWSFCPATTTGGLCCGAETQG